MPARQIACRADDFSLKLSFTSFVSRAFPRRLRDAASACQRRASRKTTGGFPSCGMRGTGLRRSARRRGDTGSPRTAGIRNRESSVKHPSKAPPIHMQLSTLRPFLLPLYQVASLRGRLSCDIIQFLSSIIARGMDRFCPCLKIFLIESFPCPRRDKMIRYKNCGVPPSPRNCCRCGTRSS